MIGIHNYQMYVFECKRKNATNKDDVLKDLYKLSQVKNAFGGPFGKIFLVFNGQAQIGEANSARIGEFGIRHISGNEVNQIASIIEQYGVRRKGKEKNV